MTDATQQPGSGTEKPDTEKPGSGIERVETTGEVSAFDILLQEDDAAPDPDAHAVYPSRPGAFDFSDRPEAVKPRPTTLEWIGLGLAVLVPPVGLALSVIAGFLSRARRGWTTWVVRTATVVGVILTIALVIGAVVLNAITRSENAEAAIVTASTPWCESLEETPGVLQQPAYGWPVERTSIPETLEAMKAYQLRWKELAEIAPVGIRTETRSVAFAAHSLVTAVESTQFIDRTGNLTQMSAVTNAANLQRWVDRYCG